MSLLDQRGGFLYQHAHHLMPQNYLCEQEMALWQVYRKQDNERIRREMKRKERAHG